MADRDEFSYRNGVCCLEAFFPLVAGMLFLMDGVFGPWGSRIDAGQAVSTHAPSSACVAAMLACSAVAAYPLLRFLNERVVISGTTVSYRDVFGRASQVGDLSDIERVRRRTWAPVYTLQVDTRKGGFCFSVRISRFRELRDRVEARRSRSEDSGLQ